MIRGCPGDETLAAAAEGRIGEEARAEVDAHLESCGDCRVIVDILRQSSSDSTVLATTSPEGAAFEPRTIAPGTRVGRFVIQEELGSGGMGVVYRAHDPALGRPVAVKLLRAGGGGQARARLLREAQALARLTHPNVIVVYEVGMVAGEVFVAMEYVPGTSLFAWQSRPRSRREILAAYVQAGRGLAAAHGAGIVHRDFKPSNVLVGDDGRVRVLDFGLARASGEVAGGAPPEGGGDETLTRPGAVLGTPAYMAPEQLDGRPADARSDLFAFCVALHEALFGRRPYARTARDAIAVLPTRGTPARLVRLLGRGLARAPEERPASMAALLAELEPRRGRGRWVVAALAAAAVATGATVALVGAPREAPCQGVDEAVARSWTPERRASLAATFQATGAPYAAQAWRETEARLDGYTRAWAARRVDACQAARVRGEQSEATLELRMRCLDQRLGEVAALARTLDGADAAMVAIAPDAVGRLTPLAVCDDVAALAAIVPPPNPGVRVRVDALRPLAQAAQSLRQLGKVTQARSFVEPLAANARATGYAPFVAEVMALRGGVLQDLGAAADAIAAMEEAALAAEAGRDDARRARVHGSLAILLVEQARFPEAERAMRAARAIQSRLAANEALAAWLDDDEAQLLIRGQRLEDARRLLRSSLAFYERSEGPSSLPVAGRLLNLAVTHLMERRPAEAIPLLERALAIQGERTGEKHPRYPKILNNLAGAYCFQEDFASCAKTLRRAAALTEELMGPEHREVGNNLCNLALALRELGEHDEALVHARRSLVILERHLGSDNPALARPLGEIGASLVERGAAAEAIDTLERALRLRLAGRPGPDELAFTRFALARALWNGAPGERARASELARAAHEGYAKIDLRSAEKVQGWLDQHDPRK